MHIPFCVSKCPYCDFNSHVGLEHLFATYNEALCAEIRRWGEELGHPRLHTVFVGGGTPSRVPGAHIRRVMETVRQSFDLAPDAEVTLEANPQSAEADRLDGWLEAGINRISIGFQSLDPSALAFLERAHTAGEAVTVFRRARAAGFRNVNVDLIYAIPGLSTARWGDVLAEVVALAPDHVSAYELTPEAGTRLGADVAAGRTVLPDDDVKLEQLDVAEGLLAAAGLERYEVSNWARPGRRCRHNLAYWGGEPYAAAGAGAHAHVVGSPYPGWVGAPAPAAVSLRQWNIANPAAYITAVRERGEAHAGHEWLDAATAVGDHLMMGLRTREGVDLDVVQSWYGVDVARASAGRVAELRAAGLVHLDGTRLRASTAGWRLLNQVTLAFLP